MEWGIDTSMQQPGGLRPESPHLSRSSRGVKMIPAISYQKIDDDGLHVVLNGEPLFRDQLNRADLQLRQLNNSYMMATSDNQK